MKCCVLGGEDGIRNRVMKGQVNDRLRWKRLNEWLSIAKVVNYGAVLLVKQKKLRYFGQVERKDIAKKGNYVVKCL